MLAMVADPGPVAGGAAAGVPAHAAGAPAVRQRAAALTMGVTWVAAGPVALDRLVGGAVRLADAGPADARCLDRAKRSPTALLATVAVVMVLGCCWPFRQRGAATGAAGQRRAAMAAVLLASVLLLFEALALLAHPCGIKAKGRRGHGRRQRRVPRPTSRLIWEIGAKLHRYWAEGGLVTSATPRPLDPPGAHDHAPLEVLAVQFSRSR